MSHCLAFAAADTACVSKTDVKDGMGQQAVCLFHRMVGMYGKQLSLGSQMCSP